MLDGRAGDNVQDVDTDCCIILKIRDLDGCRRCKYKFGEFTGTYIGEFNFSLDKLVHLAVPIRSGSTCIQDQVLCTT